MVDAVLRQSKGGRNRTEATEDRALAERAWVLLYQHSQDAARHSPPDADRKHIVVGEGHLRNPIFHEEEGVKSAEFSIVLGAT